MSQFWAFRNPNPDSRNQYPYLLEIQSDLLSELKTTIVIPLSPAKLAAAMSMSRLNPTFDLGGETFIAITQDIAGIDRKQLGAKAFDLSSYRTEMFAAMDFMLSGI